MEYKWNILNVFYGFLVNFLWMDVFFEPKTFWTSKGIFPEILSLLDAAVFSCLRR